MQIRSTAWRSADPLCFRSPIHIRTVYVGASLVWGGGGLVSFAGLKILVQRWLVQICRFYKSSHVTMRRQLHSTLNGEARLLPLWAFNHSNYSASPILTAGVHRSPLLRLAGEVHFIFFQSSKWPEHQAQSQHHPAICSAGEFEDFTQQMFNAVPTIMCTITALPEYTGTQSILNLGGY